MIKLGIDESRIIMNALANSKPLGGKDAKIERSVEIILK
ncbi:hypothetical protein VCRA2110O135_170024 [Vibrio crassostreae]|nr:hypothetical protein VCRA2110O135_170024 [Vibrio crassostreae]